MSQEMMKAAVLAGPQKIEIRQIPVPAVEPGMMKIRVSACGVCGSDIHMWKAGKGWNPQSGSELLHGPRVLRRGCGPGRQQLLHWRQSHFLGQSLLRDLRQCRMGKEHLCRNVHGTNYIGFVCNGAYAEYFVGRSQNAYKLPDSVSDVAAGLIDPLMVAYHAVRQSSLKLHDRVLVVGSGIIAQLIGGLAKKAGASLLAMSKIDERQTGKAREIGDFDIYFDGNAPDRAQRMQEASNGGFDVVFEAVGAESSLAACLDGVKPGGEIVIIGNSITPTIPFALNRLVLNEIGSSGLSVGNSNTPCPWGNLA